MLASAALGQGNSTLFVIKNSTPLPDDAIYVNVNGATLANVFGGPGAGTTPFTAGGGQVYSLHELYGSVPGAGAGGPTGSSVATISSEVALSARMQFNVGSPTGAVNGLVEMTMNQYNNGVNNNVDVSYVNSISLPLNISVRYRADGSLVPTSPTGLQNNRVQTTSGATIFNNLTASTAITPLAARVAANYDAVGTITASKVGTMTGVAAIQSPTFSPPPSGYHTWDTLIDSGATATVASYKVPAGQPLANVLYGFSQVTPASPLPSSPFNPNISTLAGPDPAATDPNNAFLAAQDYTLTATFTSDLNPGGANTRISNLGVRGHGGRGDGSDRR
jgi:hypothetical protein